MYAQVQVRRNVMCEVCSPCAVGVNASSRIKPLQRSDISGVCVFVPMCTFVRLQVLNPHTDA